MHNRDRTPGDPFQGLPSETWDVNHPGAPHLDSEMWDVKCSGTIGIAHLPLAMGVLAAFVLLLTSTTTHAQWDIEDSHTTASLRGIHNVGGGIAWASGTGGTVLRTLDGGKTWQTCPIPLAGTKDTAEKLDFRGIQAFDEKTAIVMSSGPGDQSRLYKTTDGCQTWKLLFTNPDKDGFWDGIKMADSTSGIVFGDPAKAVSPVEAGYLTFRMRATQDSGATWAPITDPRFRPDAGTGIWPLPGESFFAASNSSLVIAFGRIFFATSGARVLSRKLYDPISSNFGYGICAGQIDPFSGSCGIPWSDWINVQTPIIHKTASSGIFSLAAGKNATLIAVGGDYSKPASTTETAAYSSDGGSHWLPAQTPPHGYRSAVAYDPKKKTWITVGPNGTDISTDDGRNWRPLMPTPQDAPDADKNWNALSLPFVVGPKGRIGKLRPTALLPANPMTSKPGNPQ